MTSADMRTTVLRLVCAAALLAPVAARGQTIFPLTSDESNITSGSPEIFIGQNNCASPLHFHWDLTAIGRPAAGDTVRIVLAANSADCTNATPPTPDKTPTTPQTAKGDDTRIAAELILDTDAGVPGGCSNRTIVSDTPYTTYYCVQVNPSAGTPIGQSIPVHFAFADPIAPAGVAVAPGDKHLRVDWTQGRALDKIASYDVHVLTEPDAGVDLTTYSQRVKAQTSADVRMTDDAQPLENEVPYYVRVLATDIYGNVSALSDPALGVPTKILDFYDLYRQDGGSALGGGGCSSAGAVWIAALGLLIAFLARRRKKARNGAALLALFALLAPAARADQLSRSDRPARKLLVAFKVDRYDPKVDSEVALDGATPYHEIFGTRAPLRYQVEVDWEVAHPFGSLLLGVTAGYWQNFGKGIVAKTGEKSVDTALLDVIPLGIVATWRFDWLADRWARFPFIPYAQVGFQRALWASFNGTGNVTTNEQFGGRGSGWTSGYTTALGFAINLDAIDPGLAREAYQDVGIQRSSVFAEYGWTRLDNFRGGGALILTDRAWRFGLAVEF
jgi:hypothetical protein